jgi:hypothetical protein
MSELEAAMTARMHDAARAESRSDVGNIAETEANEPMQQWRHHGIYGIPLATLRSSPSLAQASIPITSIRTRVDRGRGL